MLRAFELEMAAGGRDAALNALRRLSGGLGLAALAALLCRAGAGTAGFGMAFFSAALLAGKPLAPLLAGSEP